MLAAAAGLFLLGYYWGNQYKEVEIPELSAAVALRPALPLPDFLAADASGHAFGPARFQDRWTLLLTAAADQVATADRLAQLNRVYSRLAEHSRTQEQVQMVLLSRRPGSAGSDGPLSDLRRHNPLLITASGQGERLDVLWSSLGADGSPGSAGLYLVDPRAQVVALFTADGHPANIAADVHALVNAYH